MRKCNDFYFCLLIFNFFCNFIVFVSNQKPLDYSESVWPSSCKGYFQSPINLTKNLENCQQTNDIKIILTNYNNISNSIIETTKDNQRFILKADNMGYIIFSKYNYYYKYILNYIELKAPTEHTIDGTYGDLEMQLVHSRDFTYSNTTINSTDIEPSTKWLIISLIFIKYEDQENELLNSIVNFKSYFNIGKRIVQYNYTNKTINSSALFPITFNNKYESINMNNYIKPNLMYFHYIGSFTTPNCEESVNWLILNKFSYLSKRQKNYLTAIISKLYANGNNRRTKTLNGRKIYLLYNNKFKIEQSLSLSLFILTKYLIYLIIIILLY